MSPDSALLAMRGIWQATHLAEEWIVWAPDLVHHDVTVETGLVPGGLAGLGSHHRIAELVHEMAGEAGDAFPVVGRLLPVDVLLVMALGELVGVDVLDIPRRQRRWSRNRS